MAATKTFATQLAAMYLVALYLAQVRGTMFTDEVASVVRELEQIPAKVELCLERDRPGPQGRRRVQGRYDWLFLGRHVGYPMALEGRSSSRRSPTSTPRATRRPSSSTGPSR